MKNSHKDLINAKIDGAKAALNYCINEDSIKNNYFKRFESHYQNLTNSNDKITYSNDDIELAKKQGISDIVIALHVNPKMHSVFVDSIYSAMQKPNPSSFDDKLMKFRMASQLNSDGVVTSENGIKRWLVKGQLHREDGPAVDYGDGAHAWYLNGKLHRVGGPAVYGFDDAETWYFKGQLHREDGPAVIDGDIKQWYLYGTHLTEQQHADAFSMMKKSKVKP